MIPFIDLQTQQERIKPQIDRAIARVLEHGRYIMGPEVEQLERRLAERVGCAHCVTVSSGTDALLISLLALGVGPGDEVITVPYTWIATAEVIALTGARPVFVDIDRDTWCLDPDRLQAAITERTKAIIPVGIYGQPADLTRIGEIAARCGGIPVIEDAAQSFGATHAASAADTPRNACQLSDIGCTSFFPSKPLGCYGDGGAVFTDDGQWAQRFRWIRSHGQQAKHHHTVLGINGRLDTIQAAILLEKLAIFDDEIARRRQVADRYQQQLAGCDVVRQLPRVAAGNQSVWAQYTVLVDQREQVMASLREHGIPSVAYYRRPLHLQPVFAELGYHAGDFPVAESVAQSCLSLPMGPYLDESSQQRIIAGLRQSVLPGPLASSINHSF